MVAVVQASSLLIVGLVLLTMGADFLVRGAASLAAKVGLSPLVIGLTVVAFGTSAPELVVSISAATADQGGIAVGNIVGSNIFNVAAILGVASLIVPLSVHLKVIRIDMPIMLGASVAFAAALVSGRSISRWEGALLAVGLVGYLAWSVIGARKEAASATELQVVPDAPAAPRPTGVALAQLLAGLGGLVIGGRLLVDNAVEIAADLGVAESVIGLTVVAAGTSLPELATSTVAALRKQTDIAVGNVVGSNIFNLLGIGGIAAMVNPLDAGAIGSLEIGVMLASSLLLLPLMRSGFKLVRAEGAALLAGFAAYFWLLWP